MSASIVGGAARGRPLVTVPGHKTRVATAMLRTSLFDILRNRIEGEAALDLFAGIGSFGLEALSRGASRAAFIERDAQCLRAIRENLRRLGFEGSVIRGDALNYPAGLDVETGYGVVFVDPPYAYFESKAAVRRLESLLERLLAGEIVAPHGVVVLKHPKGSGFPGAFDVRQYGETELSFYRKRPSGD
jgi:16S rRNA (guanine966-N2)-methyltransferase